MPSPKQCQTLKVGIVYTCWHAELINAMRTKCVDRLKAMGVKQENILEVRGAARLAVCRCPARARVA